MKTSPILQLVAALVLFTTLFNACKVSRDTKIADPGLPVTFRGAPADPDTTTIGSIPWQTFFKDPGLIALIKQALDHNNDLAIAVKNIEAAGLYLRQARAEDIPTASIGATASYLRPSDNSLNGLTLGEALHAKHIEDYTLAANLSWEADIWGKISSKKAAALADYLGTVEARKGVQTKLIADVSDAYYNLLLFDEQLNIARQNLMLNDSTLRMVRIQYSAGLVNLLAVQQADAQRLQAARLIPLFEQEIVIEENIISILCGTIPGAVTRTGKLRSMPVADNMRTGAPAGLLGRRPDVKAAELALEKANADVDYSKASMYPSLTIGAQGGLDAFKASNWFNIPASLFGTVTGGITQPLLDHRRLKTEFQVAEVRREQRVIDFRQTVLAAARDVSDALVKLDKLANQENIEKERSATLLAAVHNSQLLFNNGKATYLEVITAESNVLNSQLDLASIRKDRLLAVVDLYRSLGGGTN